MDGIMGSTVQSMTVVLSGYSTLHRNIAGGNPLCSAAIYVSTVDFTRYRAELQGLFWYLCEKTPACLHRREFLYVLRTCCVFLCVFLSFAVSPNFWYIARTSCDFHFSLNLMANFLEKSAKNTHLKKWKGWFFDTWIGQVEILERAVLSLKMRNCSVFRAYSRLVEFFEHRLLFGPFFCPVKLSGLFFLGKGCFEPRKRPFSKNIAKEGRANETRPLFFQAATRYTKPGKPFTDKH